MLIRLTSRLGTQGKPRGASILRITDNANHPAGGSGATITIRDERGWWHELDVNAAECAMLKRDLPGIAAPLTCTNTLTARKTCTTCDGTGRTWARDNSLASIACVDCRGEGVK